MEVGGKDLFLEHGGIGAGEMFAGFQRETAAFLIQGASFFFMLPAAGGQPAQEIIQAVTDGVVKYFFQPLFDPGGGRRALYHMRAMDIVRKEIADPVIGFEEF